MLVTFIPAVSAVIVYVFVGGFVGGHLPLVSAIAAVLGGFSIRPRSVRSTECRHHTVASDRVN
jgi:hypothetical protein